MRVLRTIISPAKPTIQLYEPGLLIDCTHPPHETEMDRERWKLRQRIEEIADVDPDSCAAVDAFIRATGIQVQEGDCAESITEAASTRLLPKAIEELAKQLRLNGTTPRAQFEALLERTGILTRPPHFPTKIYHHIPGEETELPDNGTHYGYVLDGNGALQFQSSEYLPLAAHWYFSIPGVTRIVGNVRIQIVTQLGYHGLLQCGRHEEEWGRLTYINGGSDTMLLSPPKRGDPCLNALYMPPGVDQTPHTHPSLRAGIIVAGKGSCRTADAEFLLEAGSTFLLPPESRHSFHTPEESTRDQTTLHIIVMHPDSDTGPTDEEHAMKNRTYFSFTHRIQSLLRLRP